MVGAYLVYCFEYRNNKLKSLAPKNFQALSFSHVVTTCRLCSHVGGLVQLLTDLSMLSLLLAFPNILIGQTPVWHILNCHSKAWPIKTSSRSVCSFVQLE